MPEELQPELIEVEKPVIDKGNIRFLTKAGFANKAPLSLKKILSGIRYFCAGLITTVAATDIFTGRQPKVIAFILGVVILACGAIEFATGVESAEDTVKRKEEENK